MTIPEPNPNSPTWPIVLEFAKLMEHKLSLNRHKGDREGWLHDPSDALVRRLGQELAELRDAIRSYSLTGAPAFADNAALEAADVANFAMMIADTATGGVILTPRKSEVTTKSCEANS